MLGRDRLPLISDREALPYVHAVAKELMRWYTVAPLCMPHVTPLVFDTYSLLSIALSHATAEDDEYEGYFIPKGTIVIPNSW